MNGAGKARSDLRRFDVVLVRLDPVEGSEIARTRPCAVVSPDELVGVLRTVLVAPMTTSGRAYPFRVPCRFRNRDGFVAIDQIRVIDKSRVVRRLGTLSPGTRSRLLETLQEFFAP
ncbi:MAG TPA: type II toxin-antitoxin system PemK/MazF family toxin [Thermoanaerobaculia bacterium]|nr:type II toxin-antitoxin system PemK/MazF family toxin [Thermoanaerobaculia bacterium]